MFGAFASSLSNIRNPCNSFFESCLSSAKVNPLHSFGGHMGHCELCNVGFTILKRKKYCCDCGLAYCNSCLQRVVGTRRQCKKCHVLALWPVNKEEIASLRVRDLRHYLSVCKIPTTTYKEKHELIELVILQLRYKHSNLPYNGHFIEAGASNLRVSHEAPSIGLVRDDGIRVRPICASISESRLDTFLNESNDVQTPQIGSVNVDQVPSHSPIPLSELPASVPGSDWSLMQLEEPQVTSNDYSSTNIPQMGLEDSISRPTSIQSPPPPLLHADSNIESSADSDQLKPKFNPSDKVQLESLTCEDDIHSLNVRQCKEILMLSRVDFSGVKEKPELLGKVKLLWRDYQMQMEAKSNLTDDQICRICMDAAIDCVFVECGHFACCVSCGKQMAECPICRQNVIRVIKTFRA